MSKYNVYKSREYIPAGPITTKWVPVAGVVSGTIIPANNIEDKIDRNFQDSPVEYKIEVLTKVMDGFPTPHSKATYMKKILELMKIKIIRDHC